jgi:hypothetical protein
MLLAPPRVNCSAKNVNGVQDFEKMYGQGKTAVLISIAQAPNYMNDGVLIQPIHHRSTTILLS